MNKQLLHTDVQAFIENNLKSDLSRLSLKGSPFEGLSIRDIVEQIESKKKAQQKLPSWSATPSIYYPNKLNLSQASSEQTAAYKSQLINGRTLVDLTGGFGVDSFYFAKHFDQVVSCEIDTELAEIVRHNFKELGCPVQVVSENGLDYLARLSGPIDWIYLDPSRRGEHKKRVFLLEDCTPNIIDCKALLFEHTDAILVKVAPMLDISDAIHKLKEVAQVYTIAVSNEVKELLLVLKKGHMRPISIQCINLKHDSTEKFDAVFGAQTKAQFSLPMTYLYEPNAAILKAGLFNEVSNQLKIFKLHKNSHLYTNNKLIEFPGRRFKILHESVYDAKKLSSLLPNKKAHISTRNFPDSVQQIRKKTKIRDGGQYYLFFTTNLNNRPVVLICEKV